MHQQLIDRIYECSFDASLWPGVLDSMAEIPRARGGVLFAASAHVLNWAASAVLRDDMEAYAREGWLLRGLRRERLFGSTSSSFVIESDIYSDAELAADPTYNEFLRPKGLGWAAGTAIPLPTGDMLVISFEREYEKGPVEREAVAQLDDIRPHLARSALMSARLQMERAQTAGATLASLGIPALVLDETGQIVTANSLIEAQPGFVRWRARDKMALADPAADRMLSEALAAIDRDDTATVRSFPLRDAHTETLLVIHVHPIRRSARDLFARSAAIVTITPVTLPKAPPVEIVRSLFDLTPSEAKVARSLSTGQSVDEIAASSNVSLNTIRTHLRKVLEKTGCHRQAEVVALLSGIYLRR